MSNSKKRRIEVAAFWMYCGFMIGITPYIFYLADLERGYDATGGEIFFLVIPLLLWAVRPTKRRKREVRDYGITSQ